MKKKLLAIFTIFFVFFSIGFCSCLSLAVHIPEKYVDIVAGERVYFEVDINFPENNIRKDLKFGYEIKNEDEKVIAKSKVLKAIENQASFIDFIVIPHDARTGFYTLEITVQDYGDLEEVIGSSFHIISNNNLQLKLYFFILLGVIFLVGFLVTFNLFIERSKRR